jgi:hypothetical protein
MTDEYKEALLEIASLINTASTNPKVNWDMQSVVNLAQAMGDIANKVLKHN